MPSSTPFPELYDPLFLIDHIASDMAFLRQNIRELISAAYSFDQLIQTGWMPNKDLTDEQTSGWQMCNDQYKYSNAYTSFSRILHRTLNSPRTKPIIP